MLGRNILEHAAASDYEFIAPRSSELNLVDYNSVKKFVRDVKADVIIHAAGKVGGIQDNIANPVDFLVFNMDMGRNIVMAAHEGGVKRLLNIASSCMYPRDIASPLKESFILQGELEPTNEGYALAKIVVAKLCEYISKKNKEYHYKTLVPCNLYGRYDKFSPEHSHLIPAIIHKLHLAKVNDQQTVCIWGDGTARREFMYAADAADAIFFALIHFDQLPLMTNMGVGRDYTINEYYEAVAKVMNWNGEFVHDLTQPVGMKQKLICTHKMQTLGWIAKTSLEQGLSNTVSYYVESLQHER